MGINWILLCAGIFGAFVSAVMFVSSWIEARHTKWPRVKGHVQWCGYRRESLGKNKGRPRGSFSMDVDIEYLGREMKLSFTNVPPSVEIGSEVWVHLHPKWPSMFHQYDDHWRKGSAPVATEVPKSVGMVFFGILVLISLWVVFLGAVGA